MPIAILGGKHFLIFTYGLRLYIAINEMKRYAHC